MICIPCMLKRAILQHSHPEADVRPDGRHFTDLPEAPTLRTGDVLDRPEPVEKPEPPHPSPQRRLRPEDLTFAEQSNLRDAFDTLQTVRASSTRNPGYAHLYEGLLGKSTDLGRDVLLKASERVAAEEAASEIPPERGFDGWA